MYYNNYKQISLRIYYRNQIGDGDERDGDGGDGVAYVDLICRRRIKCASEIIIYYVVLINIVVYILICGPLIYNT